MTLVSLSSPILWPGMGQATNAPAKGGLATLASTNYFAFLTIAREDMVVSHIGFYNGTATGSPTATVGIETVDATGFPSGSAGFGSTNGTSGTLTANTWNLVALGASATITKGTAFAVKIAYASGTSFSVSGMSNYTVPVTAGSSQLPYQVVNTGTPTKGVGGAPMMALGSNSTTFYQVPGINPWNNDSTAQTFNNTNSAKRGLVFTIPMNCRAIGMRFHLQASTGNYNALLMDSGGSELSSSSTAFDGDHTNQGNGMNTVYFDNAVTLTAGTVYRIAIEPTSATNVILTTFPIASTDYQRATPIGTAGNYATFVTSTWTDTATTTIPLMDLIIDQIDNGSGGGTTVVGVIGS